MNIYITLDYELFLNDYTGDVDNCLIIPTREILKVLDRHQLHATFFVDMAYLYRLNELRGQHKSLQEDYWKVSSQIIELASLGHRIGLHLHPQWFYSDFDGKDWLLDFNHYKLSDMPIEKAEELFYECYFMLKDLCGGEVLSFRAGGYSIQGFSSFSKMMKRCGIKNDSSVLYKQKNLSKLHYFDYSQVINSDVYHFNDNVGVEYTNGPFVEYPISTGRTNYFSYCINRYRMLRIRDNINWGNGGDLPHKHSASFMKKVFKKMIIDLSISASIDYQGFLSCRKVFKQYSSMNKKDFVIIGHPKNLSPASLRMLDDFITETKEQHRFTII